MELLPPELIVHILSYLSPAERLAPTLLSKGLHFHIPRVLRWDLTKVAIASGNVEYVIWATRGRRVPQMIEIAMSHGHLEVVKFLHMSGCPWDRYACMSAAREGQLECLKYAHENGCPWTEDVCIDAANKGHLECLRYAHENGCPCGDVTIHCAARGGHLECLAYATEHGRRK
jgi:hypothetical protein